MMSKLLFFMNLYFMSVQCVQGLVQVGLASDKEDCARRPAIPAKARRVALLNQMLQWKLADAGQSMVQHHGKQVQSSFQAAVPHVFELCQLKYKAYH